MGFRIGLGHSPRTAHVKPHATCNPSEKNVTPSRLKTRSLAPASAQSACNSSLRAHMSLSAACQPCQCCRIYTSKQLALGGCTLLQASLACQCYVCPDCRAGETRDPWYRCTWCQLVLWNSRDTAAAAVTPPPPSLPMPEPPLQVDSVGPPPPSGLP